MSPRNKGPEVYVKIHQPSGMALVTGTRAREALDRAGIPHRPPKLGTPRGKVIEASKVPDLESWCQWQGVLCVVSGRPKRKSPKVEPVFVAPEPEPEPEPDPFEQDKLFGG